MNNYKFLDAKGEHMHTSITVHFMAHRALWASSANRLRGGRRIGGGGVPRGGRENPTIREEYLAAVASDDKKRR